MVVNKSDEGGLIYYRYKLNENSKEDSSCINSVILTRDWIDFERSMHHKLEEFIRTKANPGGKVDFEKVIPKSNEILESSKDSFEKKEKKYKEASLLKMKRKALEDVARSWGISTGRKKDATLIKKILKAQKKKLVPIPEPQIDNVDFTDLIINETQNEVIKDSIKLDTENPSNIRDKEVIKDGEET